MLFWTLITFKIFCVPIKNESYPSLEKHEVEYSFFGWSIPLRFQHNNSLLERVCSFTKLLFSLKPFLCLFENKKNVSAIKAITRAVSVKRYSNCVRTDILQQYHQSFLCLPEVSRTCTSCRWVSQWTLSGKCGACAWRNPGCERSAPPFGTVPVPRWPCSDSTCSACSARWSAGPSTRDPYTRRTPAWLLAAKELEQGKLTQLVLKVQENQGWISKAEEFSH